MRTSADKSSVAVRHVPDRLTGEIANDSQNASSTARSRPSDVQDGLSSTQADKIKRCALQLTSHALSAQRSPENSSGEIINDNQTIGCVAESRADNVQSGLCSTHADEIKRCAL